MSVSGKLVLAIKMLLESQQYKAELNQAVSDTQAAAAKVEGSTKGMGDVVQQAVAGQSAAVRGAATAVGALGAIAGTAAVAAAAVGLAYHQAGQETLAFEKAIILTGNRAGVTSGQLADMARNIDGIAGTQANASAALAAITASGQVARENLEKVGLAAVEMERAGVQSLTETARIFKDLGESPVKAVLRLNESTNFLTASTYAQIKAAADLGDAERAASIAQNAAADMMRDRAAQVEKRLGTLERAWRSVRDLAKEAWDQMLNVGRPDTAADQLNKAGERVAFLQQQVDGRKTRGLASGDLDKQLEAAKALQATMRETARLDERAAGIKAENLATERARIDLAQALEKTASKQEKMAIAIAQANALADRAGATAAQREQLVAAAREQFAEKASKTSKAALSDVEKLTKAGTALTASLLAQDSGLSGDFAKKWESLNAAYRAGESSVEQLTAAQAVLLAQQPQMKKAADEQAKATTAAEKATAALNAERAKSITQMAGEVEKIEASVRAQEEQNARLGLSKEAIAELDAAKLEMLATDLELQAIKQLDKNLDEVQYALLKRQAQAYRDLARAKREGGAKQAGIESAKEAGDEWDKAGERIEQSLTDSLMRGFESGKTAAQNLRDTAENMFKTLILRPTISALMSPVAAGVQSLVSGGAPAAGGGASMLGNVGSLIGAGSSAFGIGASYGATSLFANGLGSTLSAGSSMIGAGSTMSGLGTIAGALAPIALGIGAIYTIAKSLDDSGTYHTGGAAQYSAAGGLLSGQSGANYNIGFGRVEAGADSIKAVGGIAQALGTALDGVAVSFGQKAGYEIATAFADDTSKDGAWGALRISKDGQELLNWEDTRQSRWAPREFGDGEEGYKQYLAAVAKDTRQVLLDMDLPSWADTMLESIGDAANMDQLAATVQQIGAIQTTFVQLGKTMEGFAGLTDKAFEALMKAAGGFEALSANATTYYENFYSESEKTAAVTRSVSDALAQVGVAMPATRDEFRALVESQLALGESGAETVAGLLKVAGAFAQVTPAAESASAALEAENRAYEEAMRAQQQAAADAARAIEEAAKKVQAITDALTADRVQLDIDLMRALGQEEAALDAERARAIVGYDALQIALYDSNQSIRAQIDSLALAAEAMERMAEISRTLASELPGVLDKFRTPEQRTANQYSTIATDLIAAGLSGLNVDVLVGALVGASKDQIAAAAVEIYNMAGMTDEMRLALVRAAGGLADLKDAANSTGLQSLSSATDKAFAALEKSVSAQRSVLQDTISDVREVFDAVRDASRDLFGEVASSAAMQAADGRRFITQALSAAQTTGYLPDGKQLQDAIGAARSGLDAQVYASQFDADFERLVLANELRDLQGISGDQLTEAEKQLQALDDILTNARDQLDALRGINSAVLSVADALANFSAAMNAEKAGAAGAGAAGGINSTPSMYGPQGAAGAAQYISTSPTGSSYRSDTDLLNFTDASGMGQVWWGRDIRSEAEKLVAAGQTADVVEFIRAAGFTLDQADSILQLPAGTAEEVAAALGIPKFAVGTNYVPRDMLAQIHEGEAIVPKAYNPAAGGNNNARLEALVEGLTKEVQRLQSVVNDGNREQRRTANAVNGNPDMPMLVQTV